MTTTYQIVYWRDIPSQVKLRNGPDKLSRPLSPRFQEAIDEAAMRAHTTGTDEYLEDWHTSEWQEGVGDDMERYADTLIAWLEADYTPERLDALKNNKGYER